MEKNKIGEMAIYLENLQATSPELLKLAHNLKKKNPNQDNKTSQ